MSTFATMGFSSKRKTRAKDYKNKKQLRKKYEVVEKVNKSGSDIKIDVGVENKTEDNNSASPINLKDNKISKIDSVKQPNNKLFESKNLSEMGCYASFYPLSFPITEGLPKSFISGLKNGEVSSLSNLSSDFTFIPFSIPKSFLNNDTKTKRGNLITSAENLNQSIKTYLESNNLCIILPSQAQLQPQPQPQSDSGYGSEPESEPEPEFESESESESGSESESESEPESGKLELKDKIISEFSYEELSTFDENKGLVLPELKSYRSVFKKDVSFVLRETPAPEFLKPKFLTCFSYDEDKVLYPNDDRELKYFNNEIDLSKTKVNLTTGFEFRKKKPKIFTKKIHIDPFLNSLMNYEKQINKRVEGDFFTHRGILTKLCMIIHKKTFSQDGFVLNLQCFDGQIFMESDYDATKRYNITWKNNKKQYRNNEIHSYSGRFFEHFATVPKPNIQNYAANNSYNNTGKNTSENNMMVSFKRTINAKGRYCAVLQGGIGQIRTVFSAEMDCALQSNDSLLPQKFIGDFQDFQNPEPPKLSEPATDTDGTPTFLELKTLLELRNKKEVASFGNKYARIWAQCCIGGVEKAIIGFRKYDGDLQNLRTFEMSKTQELLDRCYASDALLKWDPLLYQQSYEDLLKWIKETIAKSNEENGEDWSYWKLVCEVKDLSITLIRNRCPLEREKVEGFLPQAFLDWRNSLKKD